MTPLAVEDLPPVLAIIAQASSVDTALKIAAAHGGVRVKVPSHADRDNWLTRICSKAEALAIIDALGAARTVDMPLGPAQGLSATRRQMFQRLGEMTAAGETAPAIARALGITERTVRRHWAKIGHVDPNQSDLFGT